MIKIIFPVRCFSCGKVIGHLWEEFQRRVKNGELAGKVLDSLGVERFCCRQIFLSHVELIDEVMQFEV